MSKGEIIKLVVQAVITFVPWLVRRESALHFLWTWRKPIALVSAALFVYMTVWPRRAKLWRHRKALLAIVSAISAAVLVWSTRNELAAFFVTGHVVPGWLLSAFVALLALLVFGWFHHDVRLRTHANAQTLPVGAFSDQFIDLARWDCDGNWRVENGVLLVGQSDRGGILRDGRNWQDLIFSFSARVVSRNMGVIIRAIDRENYEMLQITPEYVRPHRRRIASVGPEWDANFFTVRHECSVQSPFTCSVVVTGKRVRMFINGGLVFDDSSFLGNSRGSIGFRCAGGSSHPEQAEVWDIAVHVLM